VYFDVGLEFWRAVGASNFTSDLSVRVLRASLHSPQRSTQVDGTKKGADSTGKVMHI